MKKTIVLAGAVLLLLSACSRHEVAASDFWKRLTKLCGGAYAGKLVSTDEDDAFFASQDVVMNVAKCSEEEIRVPVRVGTDDTRTWIFTREGPEIMLRHHHEHRPRTPEPVTDYGGVFAKGSTGTRALFPADAESKEIFDEAFLPESKDNVWAVEIRPSLDLAAYEMSREGRFFRLEFDTSESIAEAPDAG